MLVVSPVHSGETWVLAAPVAEAAHAGPAGELKAAIWAALAQALTQQLQQAVQEPAGGSYPASSPGGPASEPAAEVLQPLTASRQELVAAVLAPALAAGVAQQVAAGSGKQGQLQSQPAAVSAALKTLPVALSGPPPLHIQQAAAAPAGPPATELAPAAAEPPATEMPAAAAALPGPAPEPVNASITAAQPAASDGGDTAGGSGGSGTAATVGIAVGAASAAVILGLAAGLTWYRLASRQRRHGPQSVVTKGGDVSRGRTAAELGLAPPPRVYPFWTGPQVWLGWEELQRGFDETYCF